MDGVLRAIRAEGIKSVMVEGGARVILSLLSEESLIDSLIVTVAPVIVGSHGVGYSELLDEIPGLQHIRTEAFGKDVVFGMKTTHSIS
jgi:2,5-diamino-6-(ribosylamino)-4(3H)-pyrimidinone 5'-phosphate reductase